MKGKVLFVVGLGVGYVLGTRAGRKRYEQIKAAASRVWDSPMVQRQVHTVQDYAADRIGDLGTLVTDGVKRAVTGNGRSSRANDADRSDESSSATGSTSRGFSKAVKGSGSAAAASKSSTTESSGAKSNGSGSGSQSSSTSRPKSGRSRSTSGGSGTGGQAS